jgi:hypothetical protein
LQAYKKTATVLPEQKKQLLLQLEKATLRLKTVNHAQMAELVDALVSNTSGFISMPVRSRLWVQIKTLIC